MLGFVFKIKGAVFLLKADDFAKLDAKVSVSGVLRTFVQNAPGGYERMSEFEFEIVRASQRGQVVTLNSLSRGEMRVSGRALTGIEFIALCGRRDNFRRYVLQRAESILAANKELLERVDAGVLSGQLEPDCQDWHIPSATDPFTTRVA